MRLAGYETCWLRDLLATRLSGYETYWLRDFLAARFVGDATIQAVDVTGF